MRILFITDYLPYPPISGDRIRVYNLLRRISRQHSVDLVAPLRASSEQTSVEHLLEFCNHVETGTLKRQHPLLHIPGLIKFGLHGIPLELKFLYSKELDEKIKKLSTSGVYDVVHIEQSRMAFYLDSIPLNLRQKSVLDFQNIAFDQYQRISQIVNQPDYKIRAKFHGWQMRHWEPRIAERFKRCITVSKNDRDILQAANPHVCIDLIPNGVDTHVYQTLAPHQGTPALLFIGTMSYAPCTDAVIYFYNQILPIIKQKYADIEVWIVGADPPLEIEHLKSDRIHVTGRVEDVVPYYQKSSISIVPLRAGGGTRLKILEAMALGRPVVTTRIGCEGLDVVDEQNLMIADDPEEFASRTIRLIQDKTIYQQIARNARQLVETKYDWDIISDQLIGIYQEICNPH